MARPLRPMLSRLWLIVIVLSVLGVMRVLPRGERHAHVLSTDSSAPTRVASAPATRTAPRAASSTGFRSPQRLREHFDKHGAEFNASNPGQYLAIAQALRDTAVGGDVLETVRPDGVVARFDRASGAFVAFDPDGVIRTCFKPNDGERYFERQSRRRSR